MNDYINKLIEDDKLRLSVDNPKHSGLSWAISGLVKIKLSSLDHVQ